MGGSGMSSLQTVPLRGYDDRSLGTQIGSDETSELYGGTVYSKFTTELRYPLTLSSSASVYALTFLEAGGLWENSSDVNFSDLKKSAGVGMRLYLPIIGQVGIDYATDLTPLQKSRKRANRDGSFSSASAQASTDPQQGALRLPHFAEQHERNRHIQPVFFRLNRH